MEYKDLNDYEILYLVEENNEDAVSTLYEKYRPVIERYAYQYYMRFKNRGVSYDDFVQEAYIGFYSSITKFDKNRAVLFYTFACICIQSRLYNYSRKFLTYKKDASCYVYSYDDEIESLDLSYFEVLEDPRDNPVELLDQDSLFCFLISFKHELSFKQSCIFELRVNGFSYQEIAQLLSVSRRTVGSLLARVRQKLRYEMGQSNKLGVFNS